MRRRASIALSSRVALALAAGALAGSRPAVADELLRGPHPFLKDNEVALDAGIAMANFYGATQAALGYGYQATGAVWFELRATLRDAQSGPNFAQIRPKCACPVVETAADVLAGASFRFRMNVPVVPYAKLLVGPTYSFPEDAASGVGLAARASAGARYYLYDWLGFGLELGLLYGRTGLDERDASGAETGLEPTVRLLELGVGAAVQF
jgi:hypothetical protein